VQSGIKSLVKAYSKDPAFGIVSSATDWDANPSLIGTPTGILDLDTGLLNEFAPEFRIRYRTRGCVLEPEVEHQVIWAEFLEEVLPDPEVRAYVRWAMSRAVFGATKDEVLYILFGPSRTGKSTFLNAFLNALGNYACSMSASLFSEDLSDDRPRPELMRLINKRFVAAAEAEHDAKFSLPTVKRLTGGDPLTARGLYEAIVEFRTKHSLFLATNAVPEAAIDDAMRYRMRIIPFETVISASREDRERKEWLSHSDEAASAVLQWLRLGAKEHCGHPDWPVPEAVRKYTTSSVADMDPFQEFLSDCIEEAEDSFVTATDLYDTYEKWCGKDETPLSRKAVSKRLKGLKFKMVRKNLLGGKQRVWLGARLSEQSE
jgi:putative DNA primase/helicase